MPGFTDPFFWERCHTETQTQTPVCFSKAGFIGPTSSHLRQAASVPSTRPGVTWRRWRRSTLGGSSREPSFDRWCCRGCWWRLFLLLILLVVVVVVVVDPSSCCCCCCCCCLWWLWSKSIKKGQNPHQLFLYSREKKSKNLSGRTAWCAWWLATCSRKTLKKTPHYSRPYWLAAWLTFSTKFWCAWWWMLQRFETSSLFHSKFLDFEDRRFWRFSPWSLVGKMGSSSTNKDFVARRAETRSEELGCAWVDIGPWEVEVVFQGERWQVKCLHPPENQQLEPWNLVLVVWRWNMASCFRRVYVFAVSCTGVGFWFRCIFPPQKKGPWSRATRMPTLFYMGVS